MSPTPPGTISNLERHLNARCREPVGILRYIPAPPIATSTRSAPGPKPLTAMARRRHRHASIILHGPFHLGPFRPRPPESCGTSLSYIQRRLAIGRTLLPVIIYPTGLNRNGMIPEGKGLGNFKSLICDGALPRACGATTMRSKTRITAALVAPTRTKKEGGAT